MVPTTEVHDLYCQQRPQETIFWILLLSGGRSGGGEAVHKGSHGRRKGRGGGGRVALGRVKQEGCNDGIYFLLHRLQVFISKLLLTELVTVLPLCSVTGVRGGPLPIHIM